MVELRKRIGEALDKLAVLHRSDCTKAQVREAWGLGFPERTGFSRRTDKDAKQAVALFSNAALVKAGVAGTNRSGVIVSLGTVAAVTNLAH